ncbi:unnamed protein product [Rotaria socialis]|uniref:Uncharacterized protein n=1 Tax=Rotaria socialis TaxID=392032 RepID=A0A820Z502_9BILA|nr:unnamed protein product [Rotaria socialis]CAF3742364.1 unnamed protein product [Rotaria socialis]CAF4559341.1 unnamed protein product [Rotaria socialis]CAF4880992.1 unnamed protein product [Rotaria socialis]
MNATSSTSTIPTAYQYANPLLYTLRDYHTDIDPYWIVAIEFIKLQFALRLWNRVRYGKWLTSVEFIVDCSERDSAPKPSAPLMVPRRSLPAPLTVFILQDFNKLEKNEKKI